MTGNQKKCWHIDVPHQLGWLGITWTVAAGLQLWACLNTLPWVGRWAIMLAGAAAAWTAIVGVQYVTERTAECLLREIEERLNRAHEDLVDEVAEESAGRMVRRLELRELEEQVARLVPPQHTR